MLFQNNHSQLLFLYKIIFLSFVCWILLWPFAITCLSQIVILLFLNSPIFAGKIAHCFIFMLTVTCCGLSLDYLLLQMFDFSVLVYLFNFCYTIQFSVLYNSILYVKIFFFQCFLHILILFFLNIAIIDLLKTVTNL